MTALINSQVAAPGHDAFLLVLDDCHLIDSGDLDAALLFQLDNLPAGSRKVVALRLALPTPVARYDGVLGSRQTTPKQNFIVCVNQLWT